MLALKNYETSELLAAEETNAFGAMRIWVDTGEDTDYHCCLRRWKCEQTARDSSQGRIPGTLRCLYSADKRLHGNYATITQWR